MRPGAKEGTFSQVPRGVFVGHRPPGTPVAPCSDKKFYIWFTQTMRQYSWSMSASRICLLEFLVWQNRKTLKKISKGARAHTQTHIQQKHRRTDAAGRPSKPSSRILSMNDTCRLRCISLMYTSTWLCCSVTAPGPEQSLRFQILGSTTFETCSLQGFPHPFRFLAKTLRHFE